jgi:hypothetical protein
MWSSCDASLISTLIVMAARWRLFFFSTAVLMASDYAETA